MRKKLFKHISAGAGKWEPEIGSDIDQHVRRWLWQQGANSFDQQSTTTKNSYNDSVPHIGFYNPIESQFHGDFFSLAVLHLKAGGQLAADVFVEKYVNKITDKINMAQIDVILAVPPRKGGNGAAENIARALGKTFNKPVWNNLLTYLRNIKEQKTMANILDRLANVAGSLQLALSKTKVDHQSQLDYPPGNRILFIDDISTSEATLLEARRVLTEAGFLPSVLAMAHSSD
jgi:predicted amidophosphoribosyltransferase